MPHLNSSQEVAFLRRGNTIVAYTIHSHFLSTQNVTLDVTDDYPQSKEGISSDMAAIIFTACLLFLAASLMGSCYCAYYNGEPLRIIYNCLPCVATDKRYQKRDKIEDESILNNSGDSPEKNVNNTIVMLGTSSILTLQSHSNNSDNSNNNSNTNKNSPIGLESQCITNSDNAVIMTEASNIQAMGSSLPPLLFSADSTNNFVSNSPKHTFGQRVYPLGNLNNGNSRRNSNNSNSFSNEIVCDNIYGVSSQQSRSNSARLNNYHRSVSNNAIDSSNNQPYTNSSNNSSSRNLLPQVTIAKANSTIITFSCPHDNLHISH